MAKIRVKKEGGVKLPGYMQREPTTPRRNKIEKKDRILGKSIKPETSGGHCGDGPCCGEKSCGECKPRFVGIRL